MLDELKRYRELVVFILLGAVAVRLLAQLIGVFFYEDGRGPNFFYGAAIIGAGTVDALLSILLVAVLAWCAKDRSQNARLLTLISLIVLGVGTLFGFLYTVIGLAGPGSNKILGFLVDLTTLVVPALLVFVLWRIYQSLPAPVQRPQQVALPPGPKGYQQAYPPQGGYGQPGQPQQGPGQPGPQQNWGGGGWQQQPPDAQASAPQSAPPQSQTSGPGAWQPQHSPNQPYAPTQPAHPGQHDQRAAGGWAQVGQTTAGSASSGYEHTGPIGHPPGQQPQQPSGQSPYGGQQQPASAPSAYEQTGPIDQSGAGYEQTAPLGYPGQPAPGQSGPQQPPQGGPGPDQQGGPEHAQQNGPAQGQPGPGQPGPGQAGPGQAGPDQNQPGPASQPGRPGDQPSGSDSRQAQPNWWDRPS